MVEQLGQGVGHALALVAGVPGPPPAGEGVERGPEGGRGDRVEHAVDRVHAVEHGADLEPAPLEVLFGVGVETVGVGDMPGVAAADVEVLDRKGVGEADHLRLIGRLPPLTQLLAQVAERRGGLVADGAAGEGGRGLGQGAELPADTQPIGGCLAREATGASCPGGGAQASEPMVATLPAPIEDATLTPLPSTAIERELRAITEIARILHGLDCPDEVRNVLAFVVRHYPT